MRRPSTVVLLLALVVAACTGDDDVVIETASVGRGEVVQTVAAPARLEPAARATVAASVAGRVAELLVEDGDEVTAGDPLLRLSSESLEEQIEQAEAAVEAAEAAGAAASAAGVDVSPALGALRSQIDGVFPPLLGALESQVSTTEASLEAALRAVAQTEATSQELRDRVLAALEDDDLLQATDAIDLDAFPDLPETSAATESLQEAQRSASDARRQLATTRTSVANASAELAAAEADLAGQADAAGAAQASAVEAQIAQAERALRAIEDRQDDLEVTAPISGVVELVRGGSGGGGGELGNLGGLGQLGDLDGFDAGGAGDLLGGTGGAAVTGPVAVGREVAVGEELIRIFDVSSFHAEVEVDEIDVVEVERGQSVSLLVDAFPGVELTGEVEHVAMSPRRGAVGGALYPVVVTLVDVPGELNLRTGLTASAEVVVRRVDGDLVVPTSALLRRGGGEVVFAVRDGVAREVAVEVLAIGDQDAAIGGAIEHGEEVVTIGVELVEDGDPVP